jgi:hypothetical protein
LTGGGFVVAWDSWDANFTKTDILFQLYDYTGNALGSINQANNSTAANSYKYEATVAALSGGGFVVAWQSDHAKAMKITGLTEKLPSESVENQYRSFSDADNVSEWAKSGIADSLEAGILTGRSGSQLAPKANITRAEVAVIVQRLLHKSELI